MGSLAGQRRTGKVASDKRAVYFDRPSAHDTGQAGVARWGACDHHRVPGPQAAVARAAAKAKTRTPDEPVGSSVLRSVFTVAVTESPKEDFDCPAAFNLPAAPRSLGPVPVSAALYREAPREAGLKGPSKVLIAVVVDMKQRHRRFGCLTIVQQISYACGIEVNNGYRSHTLYYPRSERLTPTLSDPELERLLRRGLAKAREHLARRGSTALLKCVLVTIPHGEAFWLGEEH